MRDLKLIDKNLDNAQKILKKGKNNHRLADRNIKRRNQALKNGPDTEQEAKDNSEEESTKKRMNLKNASLILKKCRQMCMASRNQASRKWIKRWQRHGTIFVKTTVASKDLMSIFDLYFQLEDALLPVTEFDESLYSDENAETMILDMYNAVEQTTAILRILNVRRLCIRTFSRFIKQFALIIPR